MNASHQNRTTLRKAAARKGFTLVEVLIVFATLAVIAGMVVPEFESAILDAKKSATLSNLYELTTAIERYKMHHDGQPPWYDARRKTLPQLVARTDQFGRIGQGPGFVFGPYLLDGVPENLLSRSTAVFPAKTVPPKDLDQQFGWVYDPRSGQVWAGQARP